jgi:hypothetical protein
MFDFLRRSQPADSAGTIRQAVVAEGSQSGLDAQALTVLVRRGSYSGRPVNYFRVFNPGVTATGGVQPRRYEDLDGHPELVVGAGHVEKGGVVVLSPRASKHTTPTPDRLLARRESHVDDERVVFPTGGVS